MSIRKQCQLLRVPQSSYYHRLVAVRDQGEKLLMQVLGIYMEEPVFGSRRMVDELEELGHKAGRDRVRRLMREMGDGNRADLPEAAAERAG